MTFVLNHQTNSDHKIQVTSESVTPFFIIMAEGVNQQKDKYLPKPTDTCKTRIASALLSLNPSSRIRRFPITSFCKYEPAKMTSNIPCLMESMIRITLFTINIANADNEARCPSEYAFSRLAFTPQGSGIVVGGKHVQQL